MTYIGQTKRRIEARDKEHAWACKARRVDKSAVADHCVENQHHKGTCHLLKAVNKPILLDGYESLYIARGKNLMNTGEPPIKSVLFESH